MIIFQKLPASFFILISLANLANFSSVFAFGQSPPEVSPSSCPENKPYDAEAKECRIPSRHLKPCKENFIRDPNTHRCKKSPSLSSDSNPNPEPATHPKQNSPPDFLDNSKTPLESLPHPSYSSDASSSPGPLTSKKRPKLLSSCKEGYFRNPDTNRCKKYNTTSNSKSTTLSQPLQTKNNQTLSQTKTKTKAKNKTLSPCANGKYRDPNTRRCRTIPATKLAIARDKACPAGQERSPATHRCRKVKAAKHNDGADFPLAPTKIIHSNQTFVPVVATVIIFIVAIGYVVFQFRAEIMAWWRRHILKRDKKDTAI